MEQVTTSEAVREAVEVTRWAWRRAGLAQLAAAAAIALLFVSVRGPLQPGAAETCGDLGLIIGAVSWAPLWGALHRLALGGAAAARVRFGGLQFDQTELRFLALGGVAAMAAVLLMLPLVAVSAAVFILFRGLGLIHLGPLGGFQISFLIAAAVWLAGVAAFGYAALRLAFAPAATASKRKLVIVETWPLTARYIRAVGWGWILAQAPLLLCLALLGVADSIELQDRLGSTSRWLLPDAILAGAVLGFVVAFIEVPLTAGLLGLMYRRQRAERALAASTAPAPKPVAPPRRAEAGWEPLVFQRAISKPFPRLDQGA